MTKVAIVGSGLIGRAWAITYARAGHQVALWDAVEGAPEAAIGFIASVLDDLAANDQLRGAGPAELLGRIGAGNDLAETLAGAAHVQENAPEEVETKRRLFTELDRLAGPDAVLASSTSAILPSEIFEGIPGRARCLVAHPINPPYLVPAVEVVPSPWTDPAAVARAAAFLRDAGQVPLVMKREIEGFIMNRMQGALLDEAFRLVADGYASVEDIDAGIKDGLALRWSFIGPFETIDLNAPDGLSDYVARYGGIYERVAASADHRSGWSGAELAAIESARRERLPKEDLGARQAWRDRRLMALVAHKRRAAKDIGD